MTTKAQEAGYYIAVNADILCLCSDISPNFIALQTTHADVPHMLVVERHAGCA